MRSLIALMLAVLLVIVAAPAGAESAGEKETWLDVGTVLAANETEATTTSSAAESAPPSKAPPLPFHCIEGYSGGPITPMAYMANPGAKGAIASLPSLSTTFLNMGSKEMYVAAITQVFFNRLELGYAYQYLSVGSLDDDIRKAGLDMGQAHVQMHNFNARLQVLPEDSFDLPLPALTAGIHFKYNDDIEQIDDSLGGALKGIGYERRWGIDYTLTASKMFPTLAFGRPIIVTGGLRLSNAAQTGLFGFGNEYNATFEGSVAYLPHDRVVLAYEFRGKNNPYQRLAKLIDREQNWHAISANFILTDRLTLTTVWGALGNIGNAHADCSLAIQLKYEF